MAASASSSGICRRRTRSAKTWSKRSRGHLWAWRGARVSDPVRRALPAPSSVGEGEHLIELPVLILAKLALMRRMHETGTSKVELARLLGVSEGAVRRLLRFDHRSHIGRIGAALARLGARLEVQLRRAA